MSEFAGKRVLIAGLGVSGFAAARRLVSLDAKVRVTEDATNPVIEERAAALRALGAEVETGGHDLDRIDADLAIVSPGIPPTSPIVTGLRRAGVEVTSEVEVAYRLARCDFLAVTGTNGKTTTTALLAGMLGEGGVHSVAAGNIGPPLIEAVDGIPAGGAIALEVSSFQLATIRTFRPTIAVVLNVAEDHIDWHGSFEAYAADKARIVENQTADDVFVPNADDAVAMDIARRAAARVVPFSASGPLGAGTGIDAGAIVWRETKVMSAADVPLPGAAGLEDTMAAATAALEYGVEARAVMRAVKSFRPLGHRLEVVAVFEGRTFIDDSKATNPHATLSAVRGLEDVVLIAGGRAKGIDLAPLARTVPPVRAVVALGEARGEVVDVFGDLVTVEVAADMNDAVRRAWTLSVPGGSVLLSPGCASLDMYTSYAARGEAFAAGVKELIGEHGERAHGDA